MATVADRAATISALVWPRCQAYDDVLEPIRDLVERLRALLLGAGQRLGWQYFILLRTPTLAGFDLRGIARDMTDDVILQMTADEQLVHTFRQTLCGELGKGAREGCLAGNLGAAFPAADASQCTIDLQTLDQGRCRGDGEHGLGDEAAGDGGAVIRWPAAAA
jgi:hypothetical protein